MTIHYTEVVENYLKKRDFIKDKIGKIQYENKGILYSEMAFMYSCLQNINLTRIIESGRARGQSTLALANLYPDNTIISIEYDVNSPDVTVSKERLKGFYNVDLMYGDSFEVIPKVMKAGDVAIIDGPKMFQALILAFRIIKSGKINYVFIHDTFFGSNERKFLNLFLRHTLFSDAKIIAMHTKELDEKVTETIHPNKRYENDNQDYGYGYSLAFLQREEVNYGLLLLLAHVFDYFYRIKGKLNFFTKNN